MLSDEEKKAVESFKEENSNDLSRFDDFNSYTQFKVKRDKIIIDLIEKQQKEIEELKKYEKYYEEMEEVNKKFIAVDKIKAKIEEMDIEIQCCEYADDDVEEYKQDMEKEKRRLLRDKIVLESLLEKE